MDTFLHSYKFKLRESDLNGFKDEELQTVYSAVVLLLRRHNIDGRLCCNNNENDLKVAAIDKFGFVTQVQCTICGKLMDTTCYDEWTKERIHDEAQLKAGDHICWHRPYAIWHHAIVTIANPDPNQTQVIHYKEEIIETTLSEVKECRESCKSCDALYRINYRDCYNADYTTLRAQKLLNERKYNLFKRNCEHFISWCKTGSAKSTQVNIFLASLGKLIATIGLRAIALLFLFLIQLSHEESEELVQIQRSTCIARFLLQKNGEDVKLQLTNCRKGVNESRMEYETLEKWLTCVYIVVVTMIFVIHSLITSGSQLPVVPGRTTCHDTETQCLSDECYDQCNDKRSKPRYYFCCMVCSCYSLCCKVFFALLWCRHIECSPFTCCGRPGNLACGLFLRIFLREIPGLIATVCIVVNEDELPGISQHTPGSRAVLIILCIIAVQIAGYLFGSLLGRWLESCCECSSWHKKSSTRISSHETSSSCQISTITQHHTSMNQKQSGYFMSWTKNEAMH